MLSIFKKASKVYYPLSKIGEKFDQVLNIVLIGQELSGKTSFIERLKYNIFKQRTSIQYPNSMFRQKITLKQYNQNFDLVFYDTSGNVKYRSVLPVYIKYSHAVFIMVNVQNLLPLMQTYVLTTAFDQYLLQNIIEPFISMIQICRNSQIPLIYHFIITKTDLIKQSGMNYSIVINRIIKTIKEILDKLENYSAKKTCEQINVSQCTILFSTISAKDGDVKYLKAIIERTIELIYLNYRLENLLNEKILSSIIDIQQKIGPDEEFGTTFKHRLQVIEANINTDKSKHKIVILSSSKKGRISLDYMIESTQSFMVKTGCC